MLLKNTKKGFSVRNNLSDAKADNVIVSWWCFLRSFISLLILFNLIFTLKTKKSEEKWLANELNSHKSLSFWQLWWAPCYTHSLITFYLLVNSSFHTHIMTTMAKNDMSHSSAQFNSKERELIIHPFKICFDVGGKKDTQNSRWNMFEWLWKQQKHFVVRGSGSRTFQ